MTEEKYNDMKSSYKELVKKMMIEMGGLNPHITVLGVHKEDGHDSIIHVPIESKYMKSEDTKDLFVDEVVPEIAKELTKRFEVKAVGWAAEAWMRTANKEEGLPENWKDLPIKKEVLIMTIESDAHNETIIMEIIRNGKQVNAEGDLIDAIELIELEELNDGAQAGGRFTGLYKKFTANS